MLLAQQLSLAAQKSANQGAIWFLGKELKYAELRKKIAQFSYLFQNELGPDARVAFIASNSTNFAISFFALTNVRAVTILIDPKWKPEDQAEWLQKTGATHVAVSGDLVPQVREMLRSQRLSLPLIEIEKKQGGEYDPV